MSQHSQVSTIEKPAQRATIGLPKAPEAATAKASSVDTSLSGRKAKIRIHATSEAGGQDAVPVGLNGVTYLVPRDVECDVPYEVFDILQNAVTAIVSTNKAGEEQVRMTPRFNYSVLSVDPAS